MRSDRQNIPPERDQNKPDDEWGWWAGRCEEFMDIGPFSSESDAISEALDSGDYDEMEVNGVWQRVVYSLEARGMYFECDECGIVDKACKECRDYLGPEESAGRFRQVRNERVTYHDYPEDKPGVPL